MTTPLDDTSRIVILGAGHAGASVAFELRRRDFEGHVILVGEERHLPYERPQLSKQMLAAKPAALTLHRNEDEYEDEGIEVKLGARAVRVDREAVHLQGGERVPYDRLVVATGVRPRVIFRGDDRVTALRTVDDATALFAHLEAKQRFVIVGGGVIGLEVASAICARGGTPIVVESAPRLMIRSVDPVIAAHLDAYHRAHGVDIRYGVTVAAFEPEGRVVLSDGTRLVVDRLLLGIGVEPNVEALDGLGITDAHGVRVDRYGRSALPSIYATGDVASQPSATSFRRVETWANAQAHSAIVARNVLGESLPYADATWFWSDQGDLKLQSVGDATGEHPIVRGDPKGRAFGSFHVDGDGRVVGCTCIDTPRDMVTARKWVRDGTRVDATSLADASIDLASCAKA